MSGLSLENICKSYGALQVIKDVNLDIEPGEFIVFVGPSGSGKSTLLRMIAGLEDITDGDLTIGGERMNEISPSDRGIAMVFQSYALYPHMTVAKNMAFGLKIAGLPKDEIDRRVAQAARILDLEPLVKRLPKALSGGQRQRVAIGRAMVREPQVFLFDEPLSNLDAALRVQTRIEIAKLHKEVGATMIYVTHDQTEAMTLADRIVVLNHGQIEQVGSPLDLYDNPANAFVAQFIGSPKMNLLDITPGTQSVRLPDMLQSACAGIKGASVTQIGLRPEHLNHCTADNALIDMQVEVLEQLGEHTLVYGRVENETVTAKLARSTDLQVGQWLSLGADPKDVLFFDEKGMRIKHAA